MKLFIVTIAVFFCVATSYCQALPSADTLTYLKTITAQKQKYIGKPFSVLLNDLKISIVVFYPHASIHSAKSKETSTAFRFIVPEYLEGYKFPHLEVYWEPYLNADLSDEIFKKYEIPGWWSPEAIEFCRNAIIKNIDAY